MRQQSLSLVARRVVTTAGAEAQLGGSLGGQIGQGRDKARQVSKAYQDLKFTDAEERQLGAEVSAKLRERYGVVQDPAIHKYVTLTGATVAANSSLSNLPWTFIVLDTDGVNAFAAPGGFVHITRGALGLIRNEAELAGVLAHEIGHVMARHTIRAIQKAKIEGALANAATRSAFLEQVGNRLYSITLENSFDRGDEMEADKVAVSLANDATYAPAGLTGFLQSLADRNTAARERSGLFASHPDIKSRTDEMARSIRANRFASTAVVEARYTEFVKYPRPGGSGSLGVAGMSALGAEKTSSSTIASAGSRGVNPDRDARGGPVKSAVPVAVTPAEIAEFRKGIV
jgi:predicted Zn-dependent protease